MPSLLKQVEDEFLRLLNARIEAMRKATVELDALRDSAVVDHDAESNYESAYSNYNGLLTAKQIFESVAEDVRTRQTGSRHRKLRSHLSAITSVVNHDPDARPEHAVASALLFVLEEMQ